MPTARPTAHKIFLVENSCETSRYRCPDFKFGKPGSHHPAGQFLVTVQKVPVVTQVVPSQDPRKMEPTFVSIFVCVGSILRFRCPGTHARTPRRGVRSKGCRQDMRSMIKSDEWMQNSSQTRPAVVTAGLEAQILSGNQSQERQRDHPAHLPAFPTLSAGSNIHGGNSAHGSKLLEPTKRLTTQACLSCCRSKQKCDDVRPCTRCIRIGIEVVTCCIFRVRT